MKKIGILVLWLVVNGTLHVSAQHPCDECLKTTEQDLKECLEQAISEEDKISCADKRDEQAAICGRQDCKIERDEHKATREREGSQ
ncbi:MAG TPA: hypothetical protein VIU63_00100 [Nitrospira sp.]